jgi:hypothetical protein
MQDLNRCLYTLSQRYWEPVARLLLMASFSANMAMVNELDTFFWVPNTVVVGVFSWR